MLVNKTSHKFTGTDKLGQKVDKTKCGRSYKISLPEIFQEGELELVGL